MIADFQTDDDPLAQELNIHASTQQSGSAGTRPGSHCCIAARVCSVDVAEYYQEDRFSSRLEAEIADILWNGQPVEEPERGRPVALTDETLSVLHDLNCIALIQTGQVLSLLDIEDIPTPRTAIERAQL
jgi:hypothetical protein